MTKVYENEIYALRLLCREERDELIPALLRVYSDERAVRFFNSDNCHGDDFHYTTPERMARAIDFWLESQARGDFDRYVINVRNTGEVIGTVELFRRRSDDAYDGCGILRLDLAGDYETGPVISGILSLVLTFAFDAYGCGRLATKAIPDAVCRRAALARLGFALSDDPALGRDGTEYFDYFTINSR